MRSSRNLLKSIGLDHDDDETSLATAHLTVSAGCSCSRLCSCTPGSSLATARCLVLAGCSCSCLCSCTPGSSLATTRCLVLAGCSCSRLCSRTPSSSLAMRFLPVSDDCSKLLTTGLAPLLLDKEPWFDSSIGSSLAAAHGADS